MKDEADRAGPDRVKELHETVRFIRKRLGMLVIAVWAMTLALVVTITVVFCHLVDYYGLRAITGPVPQVTLLGLAGFFGIVTGFLALRKNRSCWLWALVGAITFPIGAVALACVSFLCPKCRRPLANKEWKDQRCPNCGDLLRLNEDPLESLRFAGPQLVRLLVAVWAMTLALVVTVVLVFGNLVDYHAADPLMYGGALAGAAALGFLFGWIARRRA